MERLAFEEQPRLSPRDHPTTHILDVRVTVLDQGRCGDLGHPPAHAVVVAWLFFNLTLTIFDATELINHLPFFGVMAMLLVWSPERETKALWVKGLSESLLPINRRSGASASLLPEGSRQIVEQKA